MRDNENPKTAAERQKARRERLKNEHMFSMYVRGKDGLYDERIQIAHAVKSLAQKQLLPDSMLELIVNEVNNVVPSNRIDQLYISKKVKKFLEED